MKKCSFLLTFDVQLLYLKTVRFAELDILRSVHAIRA
jgi:hypothetical protein